METVIAWTIVAAAALWAVRRLVRKPAARAKGAASCGTSCAGCSCSDPGQRLTQLDPRPR